MTIGESIKQMLSQNLIYSIFDSRDGEFVTEVCAKKIKGSDTMTFLPAIPKVEVETLDETHDKWKLVYEDITIEGVVTWKQSKMREGKVVFYGIE